MPRKDFETHTCETCVYFKPFEKYEGEGKCQKNPPVTHQFGKGDDYMTIFPEMNKTDFCGQWTPVTLVPHVRAIHDKDSIHWNENVSSEDRGKPKNQDDDHKYTDRIYTPPKTKDDDDEIPF